MLPQIESALDSNTANKTRQNICAEKRRPQIEGLVNHIVAYRPVGKK
jgi:hypothetical protein